MEIFSCDGWWTHREGVKVGNLGVVVCIVIRRNRCGLKVETIGIVDILGKMYEYTGVGGVRNTIKVEVITV